MILAVLRRLRLMVVTLAAISVLSFLIIQAPPGNYLDTYITQLRMQGDAVDDARIEALEARYGLERPMHVQYLKWIWGVLRGDLGRSMAHNMEVNKLLAQRLPASLAISTLSLILVYLLGLPIGIYSATRQYSPGDYVFTFIGFMGLAIPNFLFALILLWITFEATGTAAIGLFSAEYANEPWSFAKLIDLLKHLWMPALIVGTPHCYASRKSCQSIPNCRTAVRTVPSFRSRLPQSGRVVAPWESGLTHLRWEPPPLRCRSVQPRIISFRATSRYFTELQSPSPTTRGCRRPGSTCSSATTCPSPGTAL